MMRLQRARYERRFLALARAVTIGAAYVSASPIPGLTSSFVAIFTSLLPFDLIVASRRPPIKPREWQDLVSVLRPRILSTARTLIQGVLVGAVIGISVVLGVPPVIGAVLTSGLAYAWAHNTPYVISAYVAVISGLSVFERLADLEVVETARIVQEIGAVVASAGSGTFLGLIAGWGVGLISGSVTRLLLSRPYRSVRSLAYEPPLEKRPFNEVLHVGEKTLLISLTVEEGAPLAHRSLAESNLREDWHTTVLLIRRGGEEQAVPKGSALLLPGDELLLLTERDQVPLLYQQFQTPRPAPIEGG